MDGSDAPVVGIDAINLIESGLCDMCRRTVAVTAPPEVRVRRIMARDHIPEDYARLRVQAQKDEEFYRTHCTTAPTPRPLSSGRTGRWRRY